MKRIVITLILGTLSFMTSATPWIIDNEASDINFITTKKVNFSEVHEFTSFSGSLNSKGGFELAIDLASVWTNVAIRDTRMREMLFEVASFPKLMLKANISMVALDKINIGSSAKMKVDANLSFHGKTQAIPMTVNVIRLNESELIVVSVQPVIINAEQFGLSRGVEKLREIAGLTSIGHSVPVSFILDLTR
ncbi:YceI family protein [Shewanella sp. D64]|uniref:YceI family protein n=1 Tax=unclassified Shewanella TaxID=196818 RepID=UPI0022BA52B4|nr:MULTISPECIES: YceI family protein [unclassified Shewanella]MEC4724895.1 YceI family protein [Shewanella sp. D64]MEC4736312.1 YceI family protein [Shewanella sp. E94]WBJ97626.1 YceI family protein [Shewanella sp. MTB7]